MLKRIYRGSLRTLSRGGPVSERTRVPTQDDPRPQTWYTRHPDPLWGVECRDCGVIASGLDKLDALMLADVHALAYHQVMQPWENDSGPCSGGCGKIIADVYCQDCEITNV